MYIIFGWLSVVFNAPRESVNILHVLLPKQLTCADCDLWPLYMRKESLYRPDSAGNCCTLLLGVEDALNDKPTEDEIWLLSGWKLNYTTGWSHPYGCQSVWSPNDSRRNCGAAQRREFVVRPKSVLWTSLLPK